MSTVTCSIIRVMSTTTNTDPAKYELNISMIGSESECQHISARIFGQRKIKAVINKKETYRGVAEISQSDDMVKLDLRLSKIEYRRLLKLLDT